MLKGSDLTVTEAERGIGESGICIGVADTRLSDLAELSTSTSVEPSEMSAS